MTVCGSCGTELDRLFRFCEECGEPVLACVACGHANDPAFGFCEECGERLTPAVAAGRPALEAVEQAAAPDRAAASVMPCRSCGHGNPALHQFCEECGQSLPSPAAGTVEEVGTGDSTVSDPSTVVPEILDEKIESVASAVLLGVDCTECGHGNPVGYSFCEECGGTLGEVLQPAEKPTSASRTVAVAAAAVLVVAAGAAASAMGIFGGEANRTNAADYSNEDVAGRQGLGERDSEAVPSDNSGTNQSGSDVGNGSAATDTTESGLGEGGDPEVNLPQSDRDEPSGTTPTTAPPDTTSSESSTTVQAFGLGGGSGSGQSQNDVIIDFRTDSPVLGQLVKVDADLSNYQGICVEQTRIRSTESGGGWMSLGGSGGCDGWRWDWFPFKSGSDSYPPYALPATATIEFEYTLEDGSVATGSGSIQVYEDPVSADIDVSPRTTGLGEPTQVSWCAGGSVRSMRVTRSDNGAEVASFGSVLEAPLYEINPWLCPSLGQSVLPFSQQDGIWIPENVPSLPADVTFYLEVETFNGQTVTDQATVTVSGSGTNFNMEGVWTGTNGWLYHVSDYGFGEFGWWSQDEFSQTTRESGSIGLDFTDHLVADWHWMTGPGLPDPPAWASGSARGTVVDFASDGRPREVEWDNGQTWWRIN